MANAFNHFLIEQGRASNVNSSSIPTTSDTSPLNCSPMNSLFLQPTDYVEVFSCINSLKNSKSTDTTEIQITPVKHVLYLICPVMYIYNLILCSGVFPKAMQEARVIPVFKGGNRKVVNYRPISILPVLSEGIEKLCILEFPRILLVTNCCMTPNTVSENTGLMKQHFWLRKK